MKNIFRTILKNRKFQKVTFSIFLKNSKFSKKSTFSKKFRKFRKSQLFSKNVTFWNFRFFKIFRKIFFIEKIKVFGNFSLFIFYRISCITSASGIAELPLCRPWARLTSPPKIRKSRKFTFLKIFGALFPYKSYRIFIKICDSKKFNRFFHRKQKVFRKIFIFYFLIIFHPQSLKVSLRNSFYKKSRFFYLRTLRSGKSRNELSEITLKYTFSSNGRVKYADKGKIPTSSDFK